MELTIGDVPVGGVDNECACPLDALIDVKSVRHMR